MFVELGREELWGEGVMGDDLGGTPRNLGSGGVIPPIPYGIGMDREMGGFWEYNGDPVALKRDLSQGREGQILNHGEVDGSEVLGIIEGQDMAGIDSIVGMTPLGCDPIHGFASPGKGEDITGAAVVPHELVPHNDVLDHLDGTVIHEYRSVTTETLTSTTLELDNTSPGMIGGGGGGGREGGGMFRGMFR